MGLKGTDGVARRAMELGAEPTSHLRAEAALTEFRRLCEAAPPPGVRWCTCAGAMGASVLRTVGFDRFDVVYDPPDETGSRDTRSAVRQFVDGGAELILFCGGDGTARDVCSVAGQQTPILGVPSGVKMHSGVFGTSPTRTGEILFAWLQGQLELTPADVVDLDEEKYREGEWVVRLYCSARTPYEPTFTQEAKLTVVARLDSEIKEGIAEYLREEIEKNGDQLVLLGPGSTVEFIADALGVDNTLLGVDAMAGGRLVGKDLNECTILELLDRYPHRTLILSPIGAQGFVLGRGNLQLSPEVIRRVGCDNIVVVATPAKLARTRALRFDTGDAALDLDLARGGHYPVVIGDRRRRMVKVVL